MKAKQFNPKTLALSLIAEKKKNSYENNKPKKKKNQNFISGLGGQLN